MKKFSFAGTMLGILVGVIIGLSITEVTGIILGSLTSLLATFFGLRPSKEGRTGNKLIIGWFSLGCVLAIFMGIFLRVNNFLAPSFVNKTKEYRDAGFSHEEMKEMLYITEFGLLPTEKYTYNVEAAKAASQNSTLLMAADADLQLCQGIDSDSNLMDIFDAYDASGGKYSRLKASLKTAIKDTITLKKSLLELKGILCGLQ